MAPGDLCLVYSNSPPWVLESIGKRSESIRATAMDSHLLWPERPLQFYVESFPGWRHVWGVLSVSHGDDAKGLGCAAGSSWPIRCGPPPCEALRTLLLDLWGAMTSLGTLPLALGSSELLTLWSSFQTPCLCTGSALSFFCPWPVYLLTPV